MDIDSGADHSVMRPRRETSGRRRLRAGLAAGTVVCVAAATGAVVLTAGTANAASTLRAAAEADGRYFGMAVG
ncbi:hypothetical protein KGA66_28245, partial [Actinocrinis puniceicyclus]|nr:hypothetical protein [Actinocrinis puniceicyclus]